MQQGTIKEEGESTPQGRRAGRTGQQKHTLAAPVSQTELEKAQGQIFFLKCFVVVLVLLHWQGKTHTAVLGNFRAQKSGKWVGLCLHGHDRKKATTSLYDTSAGYLNPMGQ